MTIHERYPFVWKESRKKAVTEKIEEKKVDALQSEVTMLALNARSYNAIRRGGIVTIEQLIDRWETLPRLKNFGDKSINEVRIKLTAFLIDHNQEQLLSKLTEISSNRMVKPIRKCEPYVFYN